MIVVASTPHDSQGQSDTLGAASLSLFDFGDPPEAPTFRQPDTAPQKPDLPAPESETQPDTDPSQDLPALAPSDELPVGDLLAGIIGQSSALERLRNALQSPLPAYLFVGPAGAGLRGAACRFAGEMLAAGSSTPERERRLALAEQHPDLLVFDRVGAAMTAEQARDAVRASVVAPITGNFKVIVLPEMDRAPLIAPILLKSVEEPPPSTVFVLLAEEVNRSMETLASRCVRVEFDALSESDLRTLLAAEGVGDSRAEFAAAAAGGSIDRARLLASDDDAAARIQMWRGLRSALNGTASVAMTAVDTVLEATEQAAAPLEARHEAEKAEADEQAELYGTSVSRKTRDDRHRRELRRARTDELTMGFEVLAAQIRDETSRGTLATDTASAHLTAIGGAADALRFNANQRLALSSLFIRLGRSEH